MREGVLVLDLDDTLYLERDYVRSGLEAVDQEVRARVGLVGFADAAWDAFERGRRGDLFDHAFEVLGARVSEEDVAALVQVYRGHRPSISLAKDSERLLARVPDAIATGLLSDGALMGQNAKIHALGLADRLERIVCTDVWGREFWKPHPRGYQAIAGLALRLPPTRFVYVADNPAKDFSTPRGLGWWTVRIKRQGGLHAEATDGDCPPDRHIESLDQLCPDRLARGKCP